MSINPNERGVLSKYERSLLKMDERKKKDLKRIDELKELIRKNIAEDLEFNNKLKSFSSTYKDFKLNRQEIFKLISNKFDENSNELAELWFLEETKDWAYIDDVLNELQTK